MAAGLAFQARAADDRDVAPHLHHRPGVQSARVLLGHRGSLLAVHHVSEIQKVRRSLAEERARAGRLWTWGRSTTGVDLSGKSTAAAGVTPDAPDWAGAGFGSGCGMGSTRTLTLGALSLEPAGLPLPRLGSTGAGGADGADGADGAA